VSSFALRSLLGSNPVTCSSCAMGVSLANTHGRHKCSERMNWYSARVLLPTPFHRAHD
jgi:hypothetical protein